jgi:hypothetical protein
MRYRCRIRSSPALSGRSELDRLRQLPSGFSRSGWKTSPRPV